MLIIEEKRIWFTLRPRSSVHQKIAPEEQKDQRPGERCGMWHGLKGVRPDLVEGQETGGSLWGVPQRWALHAADLVGL